MQDTLSVALCPAPSCTATSHLSCLCSDFLKHEHTSPEGPAIVPRGGECRSCQTYVLWGDVIRGCYRRKGGGAPASESDNDGDDAEEELESESAEDVQPPPHLSKTKSKARKRPASTAAVQTAEEGEVFDLGNVSDSSGEDAAEGRLAQSTSRRAMSTTKAKPAPTRRTRQPRRHPTIAPSSSAARAAGTPPTAHTPKASLHTSSHDIADSANKRIPEPPRTATEYDEGLSPSPSRIHRPLPASLPSYVEISDTDSNFIAASPPTARSPHAQLSLFADDPSRGSPQRRLSRALSSLSLSSGSELPSTTRILRDLRDRDRDREGEGTDVIEVSD